MLMDVSLSPACMSVAGSDLCFGSPARCARCPPRTRRKSCRRLELRLREIGEQTVVAAVAIHDDDLLAAVPGHLVGRLLQQVELQVAL